MRYVCLGCAAWYEEVAKNVPPNLCERCGSNWMLETCYKIATLGSTTLAHLQDAARTYAGCDTCNYRFECFTS